MNKDPISDGIRSHFDWFIEHAPVQGYGPDDNRMWVSSLSLATGRHPEGERPEGIEKRCYRWIESPFGSNAYWDGPLLVAAHVFSEVSGEARYAESARGYVRDFLDRCVARNGLFLWGNHYFYDVRRGAVVKFGGNETPVPVDFEDEEADYHETRPLPVPWRLFRGADAEATRRSIEAQALLYVVDAETGEFNRHTDARRGHAFLEAGAILAETACDEAAVNGDEALVETALRVARYSAAEKGEKTGLLRNSPTKDRWDMHTSTSEVGMWAGAMLRCAKLSGRVEFAALGADALRSWLGYAWDAERGGFFGNLRVVDGTAILDARETVYQPGNHCDPWEPLFPAHDYPMPCAEACIDYHVETGDAIFAEGVSRWVDVVARSLPARHGRGGYAEHYGRCIHFLKRAAGVFSRSDWAALAERVSDEALGTLLADGRFRTHPGEDRCDAVDGLGFLFLAWMARDGEHDLAGMHF